MMNDDIMTAVGFGLSLAGLNAPDLALSTLAAIAAIIHAGIAVAKVVVRVYAAIKAHKAGKTTIDDLIDELDNIKEDFNDDI